MGLPGDQAVTASNLALVSSAARTNVSRRTLMGLGIGTITAGLLAACGVSSTESAASGSDNGGTLTLGIDGTSGVADPAFYTTLGDWMAVDCICRGLTFIDFVTTTPQPDLAERWDISEDGRSYTFHLRQGVTFHDGSAFTSKDVLRSLQRQFDEKDPTLPEGSSRPLRNIAFNLASLSAPDDSTVQLDLLEPDNTLLHRLSDIGGRIISAAAIEKYGPEIGKNLVGTGPFKLVSSTAGQSTVMEAFEDYCKGRPKADRLVLQQVQDASAIISSLISGDLSATQFVPYSAVEQLRSNPKVTVADTPYCFLGMLVMDVRKESLKEIEVRRAINLAINRQEIVDQAFFGVGATPDGYGIPPSQQGYDPSLADLSTYDPEAASALLEHVGAKGREIHLMAASDTWHPRALQIIEQNLTEVGFKVVTELVDPASYSGRLFDPESAGHELMIWERNSYFPDPDNMIGNVGLSTSVYGGFVGGFGTLPGSAAIDADLKRAKNLPDGAERTGLYTDIQRRFVDELMPVSMLVHSTSVVASSAAVTGMNANALATHRCFAEDARV